MKLGQLSQHGFTVVETNTPECGANEVLVKVTSCGVCSGDLFLYKTRSELTNDKVHLGHEVIGVVAAVGADVSSLNVGDSVTSVDGVAGYAEYFVAPESFIAKLPENSDMTATLGEPIACCVHAIKRLDIKPNLSAAVLGCGFMGLICIQLLKAYGIDNIVAIDPVDYRREQALKQGAKQALTVEELPDYNRDEGLYDIVIEAAGVQPALDTSADLVKQHGQILIIGYHQNNDGMRQVNMQLWNFKAIDVINGHIRNMDEKYAAMLAGLALCETGEINLSSFLSTYTLDNIQHAFNDLTNPDKPIFKAVITND